MKILIVEDDQTLAKNCKEILIKDGFAVDIAFTQEESLIAIDVNEYDCIVLDLTLPDGTGFEFLQTLRKEENQTPIIITSARGEIEDRVTGLNMGADDYVPKPINMQELTARIRSIIRRNSQNALPVIRIGSLTITPSQHSVLVNSSTVELTAKEFAILEYLAQHSNQAITRTMLMEHIWGNDFDPFSNVIDVYIKNIRRKLKTYSQKQFIQTIRGKGYVLANHEE